MPCLKMADENFFKTGNEIVFKKIDEPEFIS